MTNNLLKKQTVSRNTNLITTRLLFAHEYVSQVASFKTSSIIPSQDLLKQQLRKEKCYSAKYPTNHDDISMFKAEWGLKFICQKGKGLNDLNSKNTNIIKYPVYPSAN